MKKTNRHADADAVRAAVRDGYARIANTGSERRSPGKPNSKTGAAAKAGGTSCCCGCAPPTAEALARHIGYSPDELTALPDGANMGLSCGNPAALAALKPGEVVLDLGAGGGFDVFIAARKVGRTGRAIGVDMTPDMLSKARKNIATYRETSGLDNVEFRLGEIEHLPVADASVDAIISNCVINLSPDKPQVWREIARVLKPGGRVAVSDLALLKPLPPAVRAMVEALVGCVAGAVLVKTTEAMVRAAGLTVLELKSKPDYVKAMTDWNDPLYRKITGHLPAGKQASDYITSLEVRAEKS
jgi:arsenite methyltransferase